MKYRKIIHYSKCSREKDNHPGGVEKFAWYLQKAVGCELVIPRDKPNLNDPDTLYIVDNHWGLKIGDNCRVICVVHGCAGERGFNREIGKMQKDMMRRPNTYFVANSLETKELCEKYYNAEIDELIYLAVDEDLYRPSARGGKDKIILTSTARKPHKGSHMISTIKSLLPTGYKIVDMDCGLDDEPNEFRVADMFMLLSTHEGFAYSVLEAMCANLPVLTGPHGIAYELNHKNVEGFKVLSEDVLWDARVVVDWLIKLFKVSPKTRQWVLNNCSLRLFNESWQKLIKEEQNG